MRLKVGLLVVLFTVTWLGYSQQSAQFFEASEAVFSTFVSNGKVDYKALKASPDKLDKALSLAKDIQIVPSKQATYKAFWINTYNLIVLKGVIDNIPINSPLDVDGFFDKISYNIGGTAITLNDIENKKLRPVVKDARIHFVLVCGAKGCPPLISHAYLPATVDTQLEEQTTKALNNPSFIELTAGEVTVSEIFKWYNQDFVDGNSTVIDYLNRYRANPIKAETVLKYGSYNWQLNQL